MDEGEWLTAEGTTEPCGVGGQAGGWAGAGPPGTSSRAPPPTCPVALPATPATRAPLQAGLETPPPVHTHAHTLARTPTVTATFLSNSKREDRRWRVHRSPSAPVAPGGPAGVRRRASGCQAVHRPLGSQPRLGGPHVVAFAGVALKQRSWRRALAPCDSPPCDSRSSCPAARSPPRRPARPWPAWPRTCSTFSSGCPTPSSCCTSPSSSARCTCRAWRRSWTSQVRLAPCACTRPQAALAADTGMGLCSAGRGPRDGFVLGAFSAPCPCHFKCHPPGGPRSLSRAPVQVLWWPWAMVPRETRHFAARPGGRAARRLQR